MNRRALSRTQGLILIAIGIVAIGLGGVTLRNALRQPPPDIEERKWVEVERVRRGDKLIVKPEDEVLYAGIRAPFSDEPLFEESKQRNEALVGGQRIRLRFDELERDKKGRLLTYAFADGRFVNEILVAEGLAYVRLTPGTRRFADRLLAAQKQAQQRRLGLWQNIDLDAAGPFVGDPKYGNFHRPDCAELKKIPAERQQPLAILREAFEKGFAPCHKCRPAG